MVLAAATFLLLRAPDGELPAPAASPPGDPAVVWAVGDGADGGTAARQVAERMSAGGIDRLLYLGDVYETGAAEEFQSNYDAIYGRFGSIAEPTPGNHEWPTHAEGYDPYWKGVTGSEQPHYYSFRLAGWQVLSLNSEELADDGSTQLEWLRGQLGTAGNCRLAFWHRPRYSAGQTHGDDASVEPFWDALRDRASIVVNGHEHNLQRFPARDGITQFVSGAGGHLHYPVDPSDRRPAFANDTDFGALRLELEPGLARFRFVAADGRTLDSGAVRCRQAVGGGR